MITLKTTKMVDKRLNEKIKSVSSLIAFFVHNYDIFYFFTKVSSFLSDNDIELRSLLKIDKENQAGKLMSVRKNKCNKEVTPQKQGGLK